MSVSRYSFCLLKIDDCVKYGINELIYIIKVWRLNNTIADTCQVCDKKINFDYGNFSICCEYLYFPTADYIPKSIAVETDGAHFLPNYLKKQIDKYHIKCDQKFFVFPDPFFWQIQTTLIYEQILNFFCIDKPNNIYDTKSNKRPKKCLVGSFCETKNDPYINNKLCQFYIQAQNASLNHGSLAKRAQGKNSFYRSLALAKRAKLTARAMIIPAPHLKSNEVALPQQIAKSLKLSDWVILNRMPTLTSNSFSAHIIAEIWDYDCIGVPCEILFNMNADFDGDEMNVWIIISIEGQAECKNIMNSQVNMWTFPNNLKLHPCQDMFVAYYLFDKDIQNDFPINTGPLIETLKTIFQLYGSEKCFECFDYLRKHYLHVTEFKYAFALNFSEFLKLKEMAKNKIYEEFEANLNRQQLTIEDCLQLQVKSGVKGTNYHLFQLVGSVGLQVTKYNKINNNVIRSSFLEGLNPEECLMHAKSGHEALIQSLMSISKPGYNYTKLAHCTQNMHIDYMGRIMDKDKVFSDNYLEMMHYTDVLTSNTFNELIIKHFTPKN